MPVKRKAKPHRIDSPTTVKRLKDRSTGVVDYKAQFPAEDTPGLNLPFRVNGVYQYPMCSSQQSHEGRHVDIDTDDLRRETDSQNTLVLLLPFLMDELDIPRVLATLIGQYFLYVHPSRYTTLRSWYQKGLYASQDLLPGSVICLYVGVVKAPEYEGRYCVDHTVHYHSSTSELPLTSRYTIDAQVWEADFSTAPLRCGASANEPVPGEQTNCSFVPGRMPGSPFEPLFLRATTFIQKHAAIVPYYGPHYKRDYTIGTVVDHGPVEPVLMSFRQAMHVVNLYSYFNTTKWALETTMAYLSDAAKAEAVNLAASTN